jgi:hypothetical protein
VTPLLVLVFSYECHVQVRWSEKYDALERRYTAAQEHILALETEIDTVTKSTSGMAVSLLSQALSGCSACLGGIVPGARSRCIHGRPACTVSLCLFDPSHHCCLQLRGSACIELGARQPRAHHDPGPLCAPQSLPQLHPDTRSTGSYTSLTLLFLTAVSWCARRAKCKKT